MTVPRPAPGETSAASGPWLPGDRSPRFTERGSFPRMSEILAEAPRATALGVDAGACAAIGADARLVRIGPGFRWIARADGGALHVRRVAPRSGTALRRGPVHARFAL